MYRVKYVILFSLCKVKRFSLHSEGWCLTQIVRFKIITVMWIHEKIYFMLK